MTCVVIMMLIISLLSCPRDSVLSNRSPLKISETDLTRPRPATPSLQYSAGPPGPVVPCPQVYQLSYLINFIDEIEGW